MSKRLITLFAALLLMGFAYAGCGGDDESSGATDTVIDVVTDDEGVTDVDTVTDQTDTTDTTTTDTTVTTDAPANLDQAIASCKQAVSTYAQLSDDTKSQLEDLCEQAGTRGEDAEEIGREVCKKVVEDLYPSGVPGKDQALDACERSVQ